MSYSTFGNPAANGLAMCAMLLLALDAEDPGFEYEGELAPDALNEK
jgi:malate dehydrogenase (oxaloacetate-decarboxylating)(NADP+)